MMMLETRSVFMPTYSNEHVGRRWGLIWSFQSIRRKCMIYPVRCSKEMLSAENMDHAYDMLAMMTIKNAGIIRSINKKFLVGVAGAPGSGKSTLAREVCKRINRVIGSEMAVNVPMDGFHLYKRELDAMDDPIEAYRRRGAPWTFDAHAFVEKIREIKKNPGVVIRAPSFDHGVGDPKQGAIRVLPSHKIVISEGNYCLLDQEPWRQLQDIFDDTWYLDCPIDTAMERIYKRQTNNGLLPEDSLNRIKTNDRPNAELVYSSIENARLVIPSLPFKGPLKT